MSPIPKHNGGEMLHVGTFQMLSESKKPLWKILNVFWTGPVEDRRPERRGWKRWKSSNRSWLWNVDSQFRPEDGLLSDSGVVGGFFLFVCFVFLALETWAQFPVEERIDQPKTWVRISTLVPSEAEPEFSPSLTLQKPWDHMSHMKGNVCVFFPSVCVCVFVCVF